MRGFFSQLLYEIAAHDHNTFWQPAVGYFMDVFLDIHGMISSSEYHSHSLVISTYHQTNPLPHLMTCAGIVVVVSMPRAPHANCFCNICQNFTYSVRGSIFCNLLAVSLNDFLPPIFFHELTMKRAPKKQGIEEEKK